MSPQSLAISVNPRIRDKPPHWCDDYADNWQPLDTDLAGLLETIRQGTAFIPAAMASSHRSSAAFRHADLAVVDIDHGLDLDGFRAHALARYACFIYTTASHKDIPGGHRFRAGFLLPQRINDPKVYKAVVTALIRQLGSDKSCSDPCRIFYANSQGQQFSPPEPTPLPEAFVTDAYREWRSQQARFQERSGDYDDTAIGQATYVLENVLPATADGERDRFVRITAAAASAGEALYGPWSDWASRGHHGTGKNRKQTTEKFFRGFSGRSSLATLFYLAQEEDPRWRDSLPGELRSTGSYDANMPAGYTHEDYLGYNDPEYNPRASSIYRTQSIFDYVPEARTAPEAPAADAVTSAEPPAQEPASEPEMSDEELADWALYDTSCVIDHDKPLPPPPAPPGSKGKGKGKAKSKSNDPIHSDDEVVAIRARVKNRYPDLRLNEMTQSLEYGPADSPKRVKDHREAYMVISEGAGKVYAKTNVADAITIIARAHAYNPVHAYLDRCSEAEPIDYLDRIASTLLGCPTDESDCPRMPDGRLLADVVMERFLVGAVARARRPGCAHDWMPILVGPQSVGKTNFLRYLTPPNQLNDDYPWSKIIQQGMSYIKDRPHVLHAGWIVILDETERFFRRSYAEEFKNMVSVSSDRSAKKYQDEQDFLRAFVLAGSANSDQFLTDPTGNRRFLPVRVCGVIPSKEGDGLLTIDLDRVKIDRDRIWAAAQRAYLDGATHTFSSSEIKHIDDYLSGFTEEHPLAHRIKTVLRVRSSFVYQGRPAILLADLFEWLDLDVDTRGMNGNVVGDELRRLGYVNLRRRIDGELTRFWQKKDAPIPGVDTAWLASDWDEPKTSRRYRA